MQTKTPVNRPAHLGRSTDSSFGNKARCAVRLSALLLAASALLAPLAYWQLGPVGLAVIGGAAFSMMTAVFFSKWAESFFASSGRPMAGLLIAMVPRTIVPLAFVLVVVVGNFPSVPSWSAMYIAPLYFVMLINETLSALYRCQQLQPMWSGSTGQLPLVESQKG